MGVEQIERFRNQGSHSAKHSFAFFVYAVTGHEHSPVGELSLRPNPFCYNTIVS